MAGNSGGWPVGSSYWLDGIDWSFDSASAAKRMVMQPRRAFSGPGGGNRVLGVSSAGDFSTVDTPPYDMDSLRKAVQNAPRGQVKKAILSASFSPREQAFTKLIQQCGKAKEWEKAMEVFDTMKGLPGHRINCFTYTALISACSNAGQWRKALEVFDEMLAASTRDPDCKPNEYTYSALIAACGRGGRFDKALEVYRHMVASGVDADMVTFSAVISACYRSGPYSKLDRSHLGDLFRDLPYKGATLARMSQLSLEGNWNKALELFIQEQLHISLQQALRGGSAVAQARPPVMQATPRAHNASGGSIVGAAAAAVARNPYALQRALAGQQARAQLLGLAWQQEPLLPTPPQPQGMQELERVVDLQAQLQLCSPQLGTALRVQGMQDPLAAGAQVGRTWPYV